MPEQLPPSEDIDRTVAILDYSINKLRESRQSLRQLSLYRSKENRVNYDLTMDGISNSLVELLMLRRDFSGRSFWEDHPDLSPKD